MVSTRFAVRAGPLLLLGLFLAWILASLVWASNNDPAYRTGAHVVSALKFLEFALLAPAVALLLRRERDVRVFFVGITVWSTFITLIALLQFLGLVDEFEGRRPLQREPSYVGVHELGALSGATLALAFAALLAGTWRRRSTSQPPSRAGSALRSPQHSTASAASAWRRRHSGEQPELMAPSLPDARSPSVRSS